MHPDSSSAKLVLRAQTTLRGTSIQQAGPAPKRPHAGGGARLEKHSGLWLKSGGLEVKMGRGEEEKQTKQQLSPPSSPSPMKPLSEPLPGVGVELTAPQAGPAAPVRPASLEGERVFQGGPLERPRGAGRGDRTPSHGRKAVRGSRDP